MQNDLVFVDKNEEFDTLYGFVVLLFKKVLKFKKFDRDFYYRLKLRNLYKKNKELKKKGFKVINIDNINLVRYKISPNLYKADLKSLLIKSKDIFENLEKKINKNEILYKNINLNYAYHHNHNIYAAWTFIDYYLSLKLLLEIFTFKDIYIPQNFHILAELIQIFDKEKKINLHYYENMIIDDFFNKVNIKLKKMILNVYNYCVKHLRYNSTIHYREDQYTEKHVFNKKEKNIGFFYYSNTHKRVGEPLFNYLKEQKINVLEINPDSRKFLNYFKINHTAKKEEKLIYVQIKKFYFQCVKDFNDPFTRLLLLHFITFIAKNVEYDLAYVNLIYTKIFENNLKLLVIFNEVSFQGKIAALLCKQLDILTLYIPHGSIGENYIYVSPKDCDIMVLNSQIEKDFLLDGRLDPKMYSDKLIPLGSSYFNTQNLGKVNYIQDIYSRKKYILKTYKFKILLAISYDYNKPKYPFMNIKICNELISFIEHQNNYQDYLLIIKLHPTDDSEKYRNFFQEKRNIAIVISDNADIRNLIISSDLFLTVPSTTILEGILFKVPTIILDYYYSLEESLYNDAKKIKTIKSSSEFIEINKLLTDNDFRSEYINKTYNFGLQFCKNFNDQSLTKLNKTIYDIIEKTIQKKNQI